jgi:predicted transcriptional regulator
MFTTKDYIQTLEQIRQELLLNYVDLAKEIGVSYVTLRRIIEMNGEVEITMPVKRKIKEFITKHRKD